MFLLEKFKIVSVATSAALLAFVAPAFAAQSSGMMGFFINLLPIGVVIIGFYFLVIRPQRKKTEEHKQMVTALKLGDQVMLSCGILAQIVDPKEKFLGVEIAKDTVIHVARRAVVAVGPEFALPKTEKKKAKKTKRAPRVKKVTPSAK